MTDKNLELKSTHWPLITTADLKKNPMTRLFILARLIIKLYLSFDI